MNMIYYKYLKYTVSVFFNASTNKNAELLLKIITEFIRFRLIFI